MDGLDTRVMSYWPLSELIVPIRSDTIIFFIYKGSIYIIYIRYLSTFVLLFSWLCAVFPALALEAHGFEPSSAGQTWSTGQRAMLRPTRDGTIRHGPITNQS